MRRRVPVAGLNEAVKTAVLGQGLRTVCVEARCPNQMQCFGRGTATFLLLGPSCSRRCSFCAVEKSRLYLPDPDEPSRIASAVAEMSLGFCVITMVTRDDLPDGGASHVVKTIRAIQKEAAGGGIEFLISDLGGNWNALESVLVEGAEVLNHNLETVPRLYARVRPQAEYGRSLELLARAARHESAVVTKSGIMLGLGETKEEVLRVMDDLRGAGCNLITLGQYLAPSERHHPVLRYVPPDEFGEYEKAALDRGFLAVASAPLVRSSYRAEELYRTACRHLSHQ